MKNKNTYIGILVFIVLAVFIYFLPEISNKFSNTADSQKSNEQVNANELSNDENNNKDKDETYNTKPENIKNNETLKEDIANDKVITEEDTNNARKFVNNYPKKFDDEYVVFDRTEIIYDVIEETYEKSTINDIKVTKYFKNHKFDYKCTKFEKEDISNGLYFCSTVSVIIDNKIKAEFRNDHYGGDGTGNMYLNNEYLIDTYQIHTALSMHVNIYNEKGKIWNELTITYFALESDMVFIPDNPDIKPIVNNGLLYYTIGKNYIDDNFNENESCYMYTIDLKNKNFVPNLIAKYRGRCDTGD